MLGDYTKMFNTEKVLYGNWKEAKDVASCVRDMLIDIKWIEDLATNRKFLDIGCGDGKILHEVQKLFPNIKYFGIDLLKSNVRRAKQNNPIANIVQGNFARIPFIDGTFDFVFSSKIFDYSGWRQEGPFRQTFNVEDLSKELYRILKKDGVYYAFEGMEDPKRQSFKDIGFKSLEENGCYGIFQK